MLSKANFSQQYPKDLSFFNSMSSLALIQESTPLLACCTDQQKKLFLALNQWGSAATTQQIKSLSAEKLHFYLLDASMAGLEEAIKAGATFETINNLDEEKLQLLLSPSAIAAYKLSYPFDILAEKDPIALGHFLNRCQDAQELCKNMPWNLGVFKYLSQKEIDSYVDWKYGLKY